MDALARAQEMVAEGDAAREGGDIDRALRLHLEAATLFEQAGQVVPLCQACSAVAADHSLMGSVQAAVEWGERAVEAAEKSADVVLRITTRNNLALDLCELSRPDDAVPQFREALRLAVELGPEHLVYRTHDNLGYGLAQQGHFDEAAEELESSAARQRQSEREPGELAATLMKLAGCYVEQGRGEDAIRVLEEACADFEAAGDKGSVEGCQARIEEIRAL